MKTLKQTAEENHLTYNVTDIVSQGQENEVLYGFESYDQAEEIADENGLTLYYIRTDFDPEYNNDEKLYWDVKKPAEGPMVIDNDFLFDNYGPDHDFRAFESYDHFEYEVLEHIKAEAGDKLNSLEKMEDFLDDAKFIFDLLFKDKNAYTDERKVMVVDCDDNWARIDEYEEECIRFDDWYNGDFKIFLVAIKEDQKNMSNEFTWSTNVVANIYRLTKRCASAEDLKDMTGVHKYEFDDVTRDFIKNSKKIKGCCYEPFSTEHPTSLGTFENPAYGKTDVTEEDFFVILSKIARNMEDKYDVRTNFAEGYGPQCMKFWDLKLMSVEMGPTGIVRGWA